MGVTEESQSSDSACATARVTVRHQTS